MIDLTPERIRDAAEVLRAYGAFKRPNGVDEDHNRLCWPAEYLDDWADRLEREQDVEAKRDKRIEELAQELFYLRYNDREWFYAQRVTWQETARALLDRYPSLLDEPKDEK